ncbi:hypothetical protein [Streptomyces sp. MBT33]|uniref:hypothetical protein n=1 Tax=Streptomyces sp. MBT33 TaxID=1488363 RepID=UPI00190C5E69|nr:hypothetical protein [Streptomyces sp. MBT33]MBK3643701.1 hypothetical protein [Streptomyces sp. MBT33]
MTSWMHRRCFGLWFRLHRDFGSTDPSAKRTARTIWALLTLATCVVLGHATTWAARAAGASSALTAWLAAWLLLTVVSVAVIAVGAGPGRTLRPALTAISLVTGVVLLTALSWPS